MLALTVCSDFPEKSGKLDLKKESTLKELKVEAAKVLALKEDDYTFHNVGYLLDTVDFKDLKEEQTASELPGNIIYLVAVANRPAYVARTKEKASETKAETSGASIPTDVTAENVLARLEKHRPKYAKDEAKGLWKFVDKYSTKVLESKAFLKASEQLVTDMFKRDTIRCKEIQLVRAAVAWGKANKGVDPESLRKVIAPLILCIRLPLLTSREFAAEVVSLNLLTGPQTLELFSYLGQSEAGGKPSLGASLKQFSILKRKPPMSELTCVSEIKREDNKFTVATNGWRCVRGEEWREGVHEWSFKMTVRGYTSGTSVLAGMAPITLPFDSQYPGYTSSLGFSVGDQGSTNGSPYPSTSNKKPSGRFFDENEEVKFICDWAKGTTTVYVNEAIIAVYNSSLSGPLCPVVALYGTTVIEWNECS